MYPGNPVCIQYVPPAYTVVGWSGYVLSCLKISEGQSHQSIGYTGGSEPWMESVCCLKRMTTVKVDKTKWLLLFALALHPLCHCHSDNLTLSVGCGATQLCAVFWNTPGGGQSMPESTSFKMWVSVSRLRYLPGAVKEKKKNKQLLNPIISSIRSDWWFIKDYKKVLLEVYKGKSGMATNTVSCSHLLVILSSLVFHSISSLVFSLIYVLFFPHVTLNINLFI